jgi:hypothetical protein
MRNKTQNYGKFLGKSNFAFLLFNSVWKERKGIVCGKEKWEGRDKREFDHHLITVPPSVKNNFFRPSPY